MNIATLPTTDDEHAADQLIKRAATAMEREGGGAPASFLRQLYAHAAPEDLVVYQPAELASLAASAYKFIVSRAPGEPAIRVYDPDSPLDGERVKSISVIEVVNDDMPFLVDSVMAEITARHLAVRLVVHPIFAVTRGGSGKITSLDAVDAAKNTPRESFMHIHVDRIGEHDRASVVHGLRQVLGDITAAVRDWRPMLARVGEVLTELKTTSPEEKMTRPPCFSTAVRSAWKRGSLLNSYSRPLM